MSKTVISLATSRETAEDELNRTLKKPIIPERVPSNLIPLWQAAMLIDHYLSDEEMQARIDWRTAAIFLRDQINTTISIRIQKEESE